MGTTLASSLPDEDEDLVLSSFLDVNNTSVSLLVFDTSKTLSGKSIPSGLGDFLGDTNGGAEELGSCMMVYLVVLLVLGVFSVFAFCVYLPVVLTEAATFLLFLGLLGPWWEMELMLGSSRREHRDTFLLEMGVIVIAIQHIKW